MFNYVIKNLDFDFVAVAAGLENIQADLLRKLLLVANLHDDPVPHRQLFRHSCCLLQPVPNPAAHNKELHLPHPFHPAQSSKDHVRGSGIGVLVGPVLPMARTVILRGGGSQDLPGCGGCTHQCVPEKESLSTDAGQQQSSGCVAG